MTQYRPLSAVVLAAGEGTRMRSETPKVLHPLCGRPMLLHVIDALVALPLERIVVVVGHGAERVTKTLQEQLATELPVEFVEQRVQRGTGDAASVALTAGVFDLDAEDDLLVVPGDAPLLRAESLATLARAHREAGAAATVLTAILDPPTGYGRVVRDENGGVDHIVEDADATPDELEISEINTSIYCFRRGLLAPALRRLSPENAQGEYYLPDAVSVLRETGHAGVGGVAAARAHVGTFVEIKNSDIGEGAKVPHLAYIGDAEIGDGANIGAGTITANYDGREKHRTKVGKDARISSNTVLVAPVEVGDEAYTGAGAVVTHDVPARAMAKGVPAEIDEGWVDRREADRD